MKKRTWKARIKKACRGAGTYQPFFDSTIDALSGIMEMRDTARERFDEDGGMPVIEHTNNSGETNLVKNPAMVAILECESLALSYWKELGLTTKAYRAITGKTDIAKEEPKKLDSLRAKIKVAK